MVRFRRLVAGTDVTHWWDNGNNAIAFSRGSLGFVALSRESAVVSATVPTGMRPGTYCDLLTGGRNGTVCAGTPVVVDSIGAVRIQLATNTAIAIDTATAISLAAVRRGPAKRLQP
jgi:alpha-amylase